MIGTTSGFTRRLLQWYDRHRRDLPWRLPTAAHNHRQHHRNHDDDRQNDHDDKPSPAAAAALNPYHVLVSETMLQQTQVQTVIPYFHRFLARFPTIESLAEADEQDVLRLWQGLGYYSRARNLRAAAKKVMGDFNGSIPSDVQDLLGLPGVGRYTAGAVASIAFNRRAAILDGNVARVLCRLDGVREDPASSEVRARLWQRAEELVPKARPGDFNSALMELGALVCTPRSPQCLVCPVRSHCRAFEEGIADQIPVPKARKPTPLHHRRVCCVRCGEHYLVEQRPPRGRWAGMWQFLTIEANEDDVSSDLLRSRWKLRASPPEKIGEVQHALTHRRYTFDVFSSEVRSKRKVGRARWVTLDGLGEYPLPRPHVKIAEMLRDAACAFASVRESKVAKPTAASHR
jgi:A/G-specific adenine glycosylase